MQSVILRKYGEEATVDFHLFEVDGVDFRVDATSATGDITLNRDEAGVETLDADAFVDEGTGYSLVLSAAEMTAKRIHVHIIDQTATKVWLDTGFVVETYGHASAMHIFDLDSATVTLGATGLDAIATTDPAGVASTFAEMVVQTWRYFFKKTTLTATELKTYADDDTAVNTTSTVSDNGTTQTKGTAS